MSLSYRLLLLVLIPFNFFILSQVKIEDFKNSLRNKTFDQQVSLIEKELNSVRYQDQSSFESLLRTLEELPSAKLAKEIQRNKTCSLIEGYLVLGQSNKALTLISKVIVDKKQELNEREEALFLWYITREGLNHKKTLSLAIQRLNKAKKTKDINRIYEAYRGVSFVYLMKANADSAIYFSGLATSEAKRLTNKTKLMESMRYQAKVYHYFENYQEAVNKELQMIQLAIENNNDYFRAYGYLDISRISIELQNYYQAAQYIERAKNYFKKINDQRGELIASIFEIQNDYLQGKEVNVPGLLALRLKVEQYNDQLSSALIKMVISVHYSNQKNFIQSNKELEEALSILKGREDEKLNYFINKRIAINYIELRKIDKAILHLNYTLPPFQTKNLLIAESYLIRADLERKRNNTEGVSFFQNKYIEVARVNEKEQFSRTVEQLTEGNLREEREKLIEQQQARLLEEQKEKERIAFQKDRQVIIGIAIGILIIMIVLIVAIRLRAQRSKQKQREAEMSQSLLRSQMNPHFVFNAMSVIQSYIYANDPEKSSRFLVNFSRLMRLILENSPKEMIPLELEFEILDKYLNTQKMRFEDRFTYELNFDEELLFSKALIPPMIAQPFVENAIEHGQLHTVKGGLITVSVNKLDNLLEIIVQDNGVGRKKASKTKKIKGHKSMAIDITRERIANLNRKYKVNGLVEITDAMTNERGTKVRILLPLKFDVT